MPSESSIRNTEDANAPMSSDAQINSAQKGAATVRRHRQDRRAESLRQIREQIADGTLVIRQMTAAERTRAI
jgi:anti-sigma28 factor (negative regulator of flagellin synthesis)